MIELPRKLRRGCWRYLRSGLIERQRETKDPRRSSHWGRTMFLIRTAFWLGLVVLLLPTDPQQQARLYSSTVETVHRMATFCDRNDQVCKQANVYWDVFKTKLEFGARMAYDIASDRLSGKASNPVAPVSNPPADTLQPADRLPPWMGRTQRVGA